MSDEYSGLRDKTYTPGSAKDVKDTKQLDGLAKDSLSGTNSTTQYETAGGISKMGPWGGENAGK